MVINDTILNVELYDLLLMLKAELDEKGIPLLNTIKDTNGDDIMVSCPYHKNGQEQKPSAGIRKSDGMFHCFACGESHPLPDVISHCLGYNDLFGKYGFKWILDKFNTFEISNRNVQLNITRGIKKDEKQIEYVSDGELDSYRYMHPYWKKRNVTDDNIIELFDLGYDKETDCITMPVRDKDGNCLFVARRSVKTKYFNYPKGVEKPLYGLYELYEDRRISGVDEIDGGISSIFVTESMIDCILLWQSGYYAVALNGLGTDYQMKQLQALPCRKLILATDNDMAGRSARDNIKEKVTNKIITEIDFPDYTKDVGEMTREQIDHIKDLEIL